MVSRKTRKQREVPWCQIAPKIGSSSSGWIMPFQIRDELQDINTRDNTWRRTDRQTDRQTHDRRPLSGLRVAVSVLEASSRSYTTTTVLIVSNNSGPQRLKQPFYSHSAELVDFTAGRSVNACNSYSLADIWHYKLYISNTGATRGDRSILCERLQYFVCVYAILCLQRCGIAVCQRMSRVGIIPENTDYFWMRL